MATFWLKLMVAALCALYACTFAVLGCGVTVEIWNARHYTTIQHRSTLRNLAIISVFFIAAIGFGFLTYYVIPW